MKTLADVAVTGLLYVGALYATAVVAALGWMRYVSYRLKRVDGDSGGAP